MVYAKPTMRPRFSTEKKTSETITVRIARILDPSVCRYCYGLCVVVEAIFWYVELIGILDFL
jgi:hypothetical protein